MAVDPEAVAMLTSMGYSVEQVSAALQATDNNIERYVAICLLLFLDGCLVLWCLNFVAVICAIFVYFGVHLLWQM